MIATRLVPAGLALALALLPACSSTPEFPESGFLPDYSRLKVEDMPGGGRRLIWTSPDFTPANYKAVRIEPVVFYPAPQPTPQVSAETLEKIRAAFDRIVREQLGKSVRLVDQPGPGVANMSIGITAVNPKTESLEFYQYIPVALAITGAMAAARGGLPEDVHVAVEVQITDSVDRKPLLMVVRGGTGKRLEEAGWGQQVIAVDQLRALIEEWAGGAAKQAMQYVAPR